MLSGAKTLHQAIECPQSLFWGTIFCKVTFLVVFKVHQCNSVHAPRDTAPSRPVSPEYFFWSRVLLGEWRSGELRRGIFTKLSLQQPKYFLRADTGWSKETVDCNFLLADPKISKIVKKTMIFRELISGGFGILMFENCQVCGNLPFGAFPV